MGGSGFLSKIIKGETALTDSKTIASDFNTFIANIRNNLATTIPSTNVSPMNFMPKKLWQKIAM